MNWVQIEKLKTSSEEELKIVTGYNFGDKEKGRHICIARIIKIDSIEAGVITYEILNEETGDELTYITHFADVNIQDYQELE